MNGEKRSRNGATKQDVSFKYQRITGFPRYFGCGNAMLPVIGGRMLVGDHVLAREPYPVGVQIN